MEKKFYKFPSIPKFRDVVKAVTQQSHFVGLDENGEPIYDNTRVKPIIDFDATVKIHGTNATVVVYDDNTVQAQTRSRIITVGNMGWG